MTTAPASEYDQLAYADLVLRRLAQECPTAAVDIVRVVEYEARVRLRRPISLHRGSCFELEVPQVLFAPRTRRVLELLVSAAGAPLPPLVPFVSAASSRSVTVAAAPPSGCSVGAGVAQRAMALHWLAPWGRGEVESVATQAAFACQRSRDDMDRRNLDLGGLEGLPAAYLVFAGDADLVDPSDARWGGARVGVVRSAPVSGQAALDEPSPTPSPVLSPPRINIGEVDYVLVDRCPV